MLLLTLLLMPVVITQLLSGWYYLAVMTFPDSSISDLQIYQLHYIEACVYIEFPLLGKFFPHPYMTVYCSLFRFISNVTSTSSPPLGSHCPSLDFYPVWVFKYNKCYEVLYHLLLPISVQLLVYWYNALLFNNDYEPWTLLIYQDSYMGIFCTLLILTATQDEFNAISTTEK